VYEEDVKRPSQKSYFFAMPSYQSGENKSSGVKPSYAIRSNPEKHTGSYHLP
jgi:hypothetical protein